MKLWWEFSTISAPAQARHVLALRAAWRRWRPGRTGPVAAGSVSASSVITIGVVDRLERGVQRVELAGRVLEHPAVCEPEPRCGPSAVSVVRSVELLSARTTVTLPGYVDSATRSSVRPIVCSSLQRRRSPAVTGGHSPSVQSPSRRLQVRLVEGADKQRERHEPDHQTGCRPADGDQPGRDRPDRLARGRPATVPRPRPRARPRRRSGAPPARTARSGASPFPGARAW